ncbi:MAG: adenine deaminase [Bacteroidetes bacterium]|nr:adenine deaminase [Bacteroidota bacterium]MBS1629886.1 adenine deaminase [Bacteroidota bacterium]
MASFHISGQLIDLHQRSIYPAAIQVEQGFIVRIERLQEAPLQYLLPGFVDAHVHIESSMLSPARFAQMAVCHGTVATVSDPHEIANVCGVEGVQWMIENAKTVPFKFFFGAPSCVPATSFETAGASLGAGQVDALLSSADIWYLSEMMNYPGVLHQDPEVMAKLEAAQKHQKPVDGHAPGMKGPDVLRYAGAGISTDHECTQLDEALGKIAAGMRVLIREGSAAKNFDALHPLFSSHPEQLMFCSDDKHPDDLSEGHINLLVKRALTLGYDLFDVLRAACIHPARHYQLPLGLLRQGDPADFIVLEDLDHWLPKETYIRGERVAQQGTCLFDTPVAQTINRFEAHLRKPLGFEINVPKRGTMLCIQAHDGQLITTSERINLKTLTGDFLSQDILKLAVINRYDSMVPAALAFIRGFGLKRGAIASSVAHDCHNIIAVGADDESLCAAVNAIIRAQGGIAVVSEEGTFCLPLPIAGLMSDEVGILVGKHYAQLSLQAKALGSPLRAPFMTLSFMALLVIPSLKLSDRGLFDAEKFCFTPVFTNEENS